MVTPDELRRWARAKLPDFIEATIRGEAIFPLEHTRFGRADRSAATADIDTQVRALIADAVEVVCSELPALARPRRGLGYSIGLAVHRLRAHGGEQPLPNRVWFETPEDYLACIGESERWQILLADITALAKAGSAFGEWARSNARQLRTRLKAGDGAALAAALAALHARPQPGCFSREIPLPGVSGKFIEENLSLLADILRDVASPAWRNLESLHQQLGLREASRLLRLMALDGLQVDYGVPLSRFGGLPSGMDRLLIVENLRTFLTLPPLPGVLALYGEGHAVQTLSELQWMAAVPTVYWGDLDPTGFDILSRLRGVHPHVRSAMMDAATLDTHRARLSKAAPLPNATFERLVESERAAATQVQAARAGIEQEKIPADFVRASLIEMFS